MGKILEKFMKKYWKNAKKNWKSQGNSSVQKSGNHENVIRAVPVVSAQDNIQGSS